MVSYFVLREVQSSIDVGLLAHVSRDGTVVSVWQVQDRGWFQAPGAVLPGDAPGALPIPIDRTAAEAVALRVSGQPLPPEAWFTSLV